MQKWDIFYHYGGVIYQTEGDAWHCSKALVETEKSDKTVVYDVILKDKAHSFYWNKIRFYISWISYIEHIDQLQKIYLHLYS